MTERLLDPARALVLSLKPRFAEAILAGTKTVEVRRVMPRITIPTLALLLECPEPLAAPIPLHTLRQAHGFRPPQSLAYVCHAQRKRLLAA